MLRELELDILPGLLQLGESLLHLGLLLGLVRDFFNVLFVVTKIQVVDVLEQKLVIDHEV